MKTIIVPLDGSVLSVQALPYAQQVAQALKARVRLLHVVGRAIPSVSGAPEAEAEDEDAAQQWEISAAWEALRGHAESYLETHAARLREAGLSVDVDVQFGHPAETIVEAARDWRAALIVMATHGYNGLRRWMLGSVADQVVHTTHVPVLLVRGDDKRESASQQPLAGLKRILVPLDGTDLARQALAPALDLAIGAEAEVIALQSIESPIEAQVGIDQPFVDLRAELLDEVSLAYAQRAGSVARDWSPITPVIVAGDAAAAIVQEAARSNVDLIVMATHGYSGLRRWLAGSVADRVLHAAPAPLLLVRAQVNEG